VAWMGCSDVDSCTKAIAGPGAGAAVGGIAIARSVGVGGANQNADVRKIQDALNKVPLSEGRPVPLLEVDGWIGPLTTAAITNFQRRQFPGWRPDSRVDPDGKTLRRINDLVSGSMPPEVAKAYASIPEALMRVRAARARLFAVKTRLGLPNALTGQAETRIANWNFKVDRAGDGEAQVDRITAVYGRMEETLVMAGHLLRPAAGGANFQLFLPSYGSPMNKTAAAYTTLGGYYYGLEEKDTSGEYKKAIYITPQYFEKVFAVSILIHELAHYCGGKEKTPDTIEHRASPRPAPTGRRLENGAHNYAGMTADEAYRNAQSYQCFCFPETDGKPPG
jgi:peptidoglycan hydrolase-like protein with peptidoglycan-binding domain